MKRVLRLLTIAPFCLSLTACPPPDKDVATFREVLPTAQDVKLDVPVGDAASTTQALPALSPGLVIQDANGAGQFAQFYTLTRQLFDLTNVGTAWVLGMVWTVVQFQPTTISDSTATWGPWSESLHPAEWRFQISELSDGAYTYVLEGRAKGSDDPFEAVLTGDGFDKTSGSHGKGTFTFNHDVANKLDPARLLAEKSDGTITVTYDLRALPTRIQVETRPSSDERWYDIEVTRETSGGGRVDLSGSMNIEGTTSASLEDLVMHSRWDVSGAGRADAVVSGGDLSELNDALKLSECWSEKFSRVYYKDNYETQPTVGEESSCAFQGAEH